MYLEKSEIYNLGLFSNGIFYEDYFHFVNNNRLGDGLVIENYGMWIRFLRHLMRNK